VKSSMIYRYFDSLSERASGWKRRRWNYSSRPYGIGLNDLSLLSLDYRFFKR
jgi:hypothetical protein